MTTNPGTLRKRSMTAAKRSLTLIRDAVLTHLDILEGGGVPESTFTASVLKYQAALDVLHALDQLGEDAGGNGTVEVSVEALTALIELLRASDVGYAIHDAEEGSPLAGIIAITGTGEPAEEQS